MSLTAIVVGGSRGIGLAIAHKFVRHGISVTLVSRNKQNLVKSADWLLREAALREKNSTSVDYHVCDIADESNVQDVCKRMLHQVSQNNQSVDILVNSAGITHNKMLLSSTSNNIREVLETNLLGTLLITKIVSKQMVKQKKGLIINIGSVVGSNGNAGQAVYSASKAALTGLTKSLSKELGSKGIRVNLISPGFIETDMTRENVSDVQLENIKKLIPLQRIGLPEEVANVAYFLTGNSFITGAVINVDGGLSLTF